MERLVHLGDQPVDGHAVAPFAFRLQVDHRLEHLQGRGIGGSRGATRLAPDRRDLGKALDDLVLGLEQLAGLGDRDAGQRRRHIEQRAFVERRHELAADPRCGPKTRGKHADGNEDGRHLVSQRQLDRRAVDRGQDAIHGVLALRHDAPAHEEHHQRRHEQDRQQRRRGHGERLGIGERLEEAPLLRFQREDRQEGYGDDEQAEEERGTNLDRRLDDDLGAGLAGRRVLQPLMSIFNHDDGRIDHGADGNGDAAETHDVGGEAERPHADIGDEHAERQRDDGDEGAPRMQEEDDANQRDDEAFLDQRALQRVDGAVDEVRAIVHRLHADALGQARHDLGQTVLDVLDHRQRILAEALERDAGDDLPFPVQLGQAAAFVGHELHARDVLQKHRHAALILDDDVLDVLEARDIAAPAHHVFTLGELERAAADIHVAVADDVPDLGERDAERL